MHISAFIKNKNKANLFYRVVTVRFWKEIPLFWAIRIRKHWLSNNIIDGAILLHTYDGSGQSTHPDITTWKEETYLTCTPYPYACAKYENPCVYHGKNLREMVLCNGAAPLAKPTGSCSSDYCSDSALIVFQNKLYCFWRDTWKNPDQSITEQLLFRSTDDGNKWAISSAAYKNHYSDATELQLSPTFINYRDIQLYRFYVRKTRGWGGDIEVCYSKNARAWTEPVQMEISGAPDGYDLWHIGVASEQFSKSIDEYSAKLRGVFLYRNNYDPDMYALFYADGNLKERKWWIRQQIAVEEMKKGQFYPYKSAFLPDGSGVICGIVNRQNQWYLWEHKCKFCDITMEEG